MKLASSICSSSGLGVELAFLLGLRSRSPSPRGFGNGFNRFHLEPGEGRARSRAAIRSPGNHSSIGGCHQPREVLVVEAVVG